MRSRYLFGIVVFVSILMSTLLSGPTYAITNGQPDGDAHPYVCWVVSYPGVGDYIYLGTGSLIAPKVVLTAGHVADVGDPSEGAWAFVSFAPTASWPPGGARDWIVVESWYTHPKYEIGAYPQLKNWISYDVGILNLKKRVRVGEYCELPEEGLVDTLEMGTPVDQVGYGVQEMFHELGAGPPDWDWIEFGTRYYAPAELVDSDHVFGDEFIKLTANAAQEKGGTAFGDSGGPNLLGGTDTILAVTSWGTNYNCAGVSYAQRVDTPDVLDWIADFL